MTFDDYNDELREGIERILRTGKTDNLLHKASCDCVFSSIVLLFLTVIPFTVIN